MTNTIHKHLGEQMNNIPILSNNIRYQNLKISHG